MAPVLPPVAAAIPPDPALYDLPDWVTEIRPHQAEAVEQVLEAFEAGAQVVYLDGPTGTGKTLIAEMVRQRIEGNALYVCSDKSLQDQFANDFPYAKVLKGRANYPTQSNPNATAADCVAKSFRDMCFHCEDGKFGCPYELAKKEALGSPLAVTNISYLLAEANYVGGFSGRNLIIVDEADTLESMLMGFVEFRIPVKYMSMARMDPPKKGSRKKTIIEWLKDFVDTFAPIAQAEPDIKAQRGMNSVVTGAIRVTAELERELRLKGENQDSDEDSGLWLRDYESRDDTFIMKPVKVSNMGVRNLWRHSDKWLVMSATLISSDEMSESLGLPLDYSTVVVPMTFPVENRKIIMAPVANVTYKEMKEGTAVEDLAFAIQTIVLNHPGERVLVHTVSYDLSERLAYQLRRGNYQIGKRMVVTYDSARERNNALERYRQTPGAVLFAPSMERGIDLPNDQCRVQIIAKVPFPSLKDRQVSSRMHMGNEGQVWYAVQTIRDIVQMCGRGVRHKDDWCVTYILDQQFARNLWARWKSLFPNWFTEAVNTRTDIRYLMRPKHNNR